MKEVEVGSFIDAAYIKMDPASSLANPKMTSGPSGSVQHTSDGYSNVPSQTRLKKGNATTMHEVSDLTIQSITTILRPAYYRFQDRESTVFI